MDKKCEACGKDFSKPYNRSVKEWQKTRFCSKQCAARSKSAETKQKISQSLKGRNSHETNPRWKGEQASLAAIHAWVARYKPRTYTCEDCGKIGPTDWSNVDHTYRRDLDDYTERCKKCHTAYDLKHDLRVFPFPIT